MLFLILVERLQAGKTTLFQTKHGLFLFEAGKPVREITSVCALPGNDIWALVDGDVKGCQPHPGLLEHANIRIVMASSLKPHEELTWLKKKQNIGGYYIMKTWSKEELFLAGYVLLFLLLKDQPESQL
jgi:hypothetical protein